MKNLFFRYSAIIFIGFSAGIVNGLFGTGGGIFIVFLFSRIYANSHEYEKKDCFAMTLAVTLAFSAVSLFGYLQNGSIEAGRLQPVFLPAFLGGIAGAYLLERIKVGILRKIFAGIVIYAGISLILR
ncbi:MAG: sulfite exporter TauE/SafE family protein [Ruminococcaceae bacterium]|nr:sulfite exporter TauE/SafE family protein [Oscillospiraceae bacterium]